MHVCAPGQQALHAFPMESFVSPQLEALPDGFWGWGHGKTVRSGETRSDSLKQLRRQCSLELVVTLSGGSGVGATASLGCAPAVANAGSGAGLGGGGGSAETVCGVEKASWVMLDVHHRLEVAEVKLPFCPVLCLLRPPPRPTHPLCRGGFVVRADRTPCCAPCCSNMCGKSPRRRVTHGPRPQQLKLLLCRQRSPLKPPPRRQPQLRAPEFSKSKTQVAWATRHQGLKARG